MMHPLSIETSSTVLSTLIESLLGVNKLKNIYDSRLRDQNISEKMSAKAFLDHVISTLNVTMSLQHSERIADIPKTGPLVIVANHPLGALEGILLSQLLLTIRDDVKVLTNEILLRIPEFEGLFVGVDVIRQNKARENSSGMRVIAKHLKTGGAVLVFPAGKVSSYDLKNRITRDREWNPMIGRLALKYNATCIPLYINAHNKLSFYLSEYIHKHLRTLLLPRAMLSKRNQTIDVVVGDVVKQSDLRYFPDGIALTRYLNLCTELLSPVADSSEPVPLLENTTQANIREDVATNELLLQLQKLDSKCLLQYKQFSVYCASYSELGCMMQQIGIDRERTFRLVNEGTGRELDSDHFDPNYDHLWIWDSDNNKIAGGYRLGKTEIIVNEHGLEGLYSSSLYHYGHKFLKQMGATIEVGRSFVTPEYQRHPRVLDLLWKGIGRYITSNPGYHTLFGCVSISKEYSPKAKTFIVESLLENYPATDKYREEVKPVSPYNKTASSWSKSLLKQFSDIPIINKLVGRIDEGKTIPILIRHYLSLNGKFIEFSVNHNFNDSLDGLIIVDLRDTSRAYLNRYLTESGATEFLSYWDEHESAK